MKLLIRYISCVIFFVSPVYSAQQWSVQIEEPTGLYRRTGEVAGIPLKELGGKTKGYQVLDPQNRELPWQVTGNEFLFPASVMPGTVPAYRISCCSDDDPRFENSIVARKIGLQRLELQNERFRVVVNTRTGAIVEAYNLSADSRRVVNIVETTPETPDQNDIHSTEQLKIDASPILAENMGWTSLGGSGEFTRVDILESGPLRARVRLEREAESWELTFTHNSAWLRWRANRGFRFASISALPYFPFDRCVDGSEYRYPLGPETYEPPDHEITPREWDKLPGGHAVYYRKDENYGALGIVALDEDLNWNAVGSRKFEAQKESGETEIAITFPAWDGNGTVLNARRENRTLRQPLLVSVSESPDTSHSKAASLAKRTKTYKVGKAVDRPTPFQAHALPLDGEWELAWGEKGGGPSSEWKKVTVPGSVQLQWLPSEEKYSPETAWISLKEWWYRKQISLPKDLGESRVRLQFDATDYYADTYVNGQFVGRHEGYIDPYEYDITSFVKADTQNEIRVRVWTPVNYYWRHRPYTVNGAYGAVDQKPDDITPLGITRSTRLILSPGAWIQDIAIDTRLSGQGAEVEIEADVTGPEGQYEWELTLQPGNFESRDTYRIRTRVSDRKMRFVIPVEDPKLWWTWDHGKPNLYRLEARLLNLQGQAIDGQTIAIGIREIEKLGWHFYLNRKRLFIRGTNYYYNLYLSEMQRKDYERDIGMMLDMNINMIRLHCHFTNPEFYDLADEQGILVWQDFLEAWYPDDTGFSIHAAQLYDNHIRYVRNHPSIAIWAASDEEGLENYRDLTKHLAARPAFLDPQNRPVARSTGRYGDAHSYYGWYGGSVWEYTKLTEDFVSELGATALPNYESLIKFLPDAWPIEDHADRWVYHKLQIPEAMRAWGEPGDLTLQEYIPGTQAYVARLFQLALERMRRIKYQPSGGILHFHAIDIWPSVTMAAIDFYRVPTKTFYTVQRSFAPVLASIEYAQDKWQTGEQVQCGIWAINDYWHEIPQAQIHWRIVNADEVELDSGSYSLTFAPDSSTKLGQISWTAGKPGDYRLKAEVVGKDGEKISENLFEFRVE